MQSLVDYPLRILIVAFSFLAILSISILHINTSQMQAYTDYVQAQVINSNGLTGSVLVDAQKTAKRSFSNSGVYYVINPKTHEPFQWFVDNAGNPVKDAVSKADAAVKAAGFTDASYGSRISFDVRASYGTPLISYFTKSANRNISITRSVSAVVNSYNKS